MNAPSSAPPPKKVIVIDDSRTARLQVRNALVAAGFAVVEAVDGEDGLEQIRAHEDATLVLCDLNMPRLDGLDVLECAKSSGWADGKTFVMLTSEAAPDVVQRAKDRGAKGWIVKPFRPDLLVLAVKKLTA
jgi:two-component system chemotaxis response regulator CheY